MVQFVNERRRRYEPVIWPTLNNDRIFEPQSDRGKVERMLKALIKSLENRHLNP